MRKWIVLILLLVNAVAAWAQLEVTELLVRRKGADVNIRVNVRNPTGHRVQGPIRIALFVRQTENDAWQRVKVWKDVRFLAAGNRVARDFFEENNSLLRQLAANGSFLVQARVTTPNGKDVVQEGSYTLESETGH